MNLSNLSSTKTILDTDRETKHMRLGVLYDRYEPPLSSLQTYDVEVVPVDANDLVSPAQLRGVEALYLYAWGEGVRNFHKILPGLIDLRWIHVANVGVEDVLTPYLRESAITVTNSRGVFDQAIAEYVLGAILYGIKDMQTTIDDQRSMRWHRRNTRSLRGSKIVIFGAGSIGKRTADILMGLGVEVIMIGRTGRRHPEYGYIHAFEETGAIISCGLDALVVAAPITDETRDFFNRTLFQELEPDRTHFINVGRGELVVEDDLLWALKERYLRSALLDVFRKEPLPSSSPLWLAERLVVSPHISGEVDEWQAGMHDIFLGNLDRWLSHAPLQNVVDKRLGYVPSGS